MRDDPVYPSAPSATTFRDGIEFQDWVCVQLARDGIILQNLASKKYQYEVGENLQGFEIKLDNLCTETGRLSIEIAEKSNAANEAWVPSGIYREDNSWLYIQGNRSRLWIFAKKALRKWHAYWKKQAPARVYESESHGTVRKFYLSQDDADSLAARVIIPRDLRLVRGTP